MLPPMSIWCGKSSRLLASDSLSKLPFVPASKVSWNSSGSAIAGSYVRWQEGRAEARPGRSSALAVVGVLIVPQLINLADAHERARVGAGQGDVAAVVEVDQRRVAERLNAVDRVAARGRQVALLHGLAEAQLGGVVDLHHAVVAAAVDQLEAHDAALADEDPAALEQRERLAVELQVVRAVVLM